MNLLQWHRLGLPSWSYRLRQVAPGKSWMSHPEIPNNANTHMILGLGLTLLTYSGNQYAARLKTFDAASTSRRTADHVDRKYGEQGSGFALFALLGPASPERNQSHSGPWKNTWMRELSKMPVCLRGFWVCNCAVSESCATCTWYINRNCIVSELVCWVTLEMYKIQKHIIYLTYLFLEQVRYECILPACGRICSVYAEDGSDTQG